MLTQFEWHTEEPDGSDTGRVAPANEQQPASGRRWLLLLFVFLLALSAGYLLYQQLSARAADATVTAETAALAAHQLVSAAIAGGDQELFSAILDSDSPGWAQGQRALFENDLLLHRQPLGLTAVGTARVLSVDTAPSLGEAEVTAEQAYAADGFAQPLALRQRYRYQNDTAGWQLAALPAVQPSGWQRASADYLTADYPKGEGALAARLHQDLDQAVRHMCATLPDVACPADLHFIVYFDPDPNSLAELADPQATLRRPSAAGLRLPSPAVVGVPADDAAYRALLRGYARHVVAAAITESVGYQCCAKGRFYQALLDRQLATLGLKPWPLDEAAYVRLYRSPVPDLAVLEQLWQAPPLREADDVVTLRIYTIASMLQRYRPEMSIADAQRLLVASETYAAWRTALREVGEQGTGLSNSNR